MSQPSDLLLQNLELIERIIYSICRRKGMDPGEIEEFSAIVKLRLVENDYAVIRAFGGRSKFSTYIAAVVTRLLLDHHDRQWGKWRPSKEAERLGATAVALERLLYRDRSSFDEAFAELRLTFPELKREEAEQLAVRIPYRVRRRAIPLDDLTLVAPPPSGSSSEQIETARRVSEIVNGFIEGQSEDDRTLLRLRFDSDMTVAQIGRALGQETGGLYRRLYRMFDELQRKLVRGGIRKEDVHSLIGRDNDFLDFNLKKREVRPSEDGESTVAGPGEEDSHDP